ncbi:MAG: GAF domain-containing protein, partial [Armatimonadota bacterium]
AGFPAADSTTYAAGSRAALLAAAFTSGATTSGFRQRHAGSRRAPAIESYFYVSLAFALLARALSSVRFDYWWLCSQVLFLKSWLVFAGAGSIENAVAHKENADRLEQMEALHDISWSLVGAKTVRELVNLLANTVREKLGAAIVAVYLADESRETLEVAAISGPDICLKSLGARYPVFSADRRPGFHSGHTARAFTTKEVQTAADVFVDVELVPWRIIARDNGCAVSVPLIDKGEASGVLNVYFSDRRQLSAERLKLLRTIAAAAAPAIENARSSEAFRAGIRELNRAA